MASISMPRLLWYGDSVYRWWTLCALYVLWMYVHIFNLQSKKMLSLLYGSKRIKISKKTAWKSQNSQVIRLFRRLHASKLNESPPFEKFCLRYWMFFVAPCGTLTLYLCDVASYTLVELTICCLVGDWAERRVSWGVGEWVGRRRQTLLVI